MDQENFFVLRDEEGNPITPVRPKVKQDKYRTHPKWRPNIPERDKMTYKDHLKKAILRKLEQGEITKKEYNFKLRNL